jgi:hypothetical protein
MEEMTMVISRLVADVVESRIDSDDTILQVSEAAFKRHFDKTPFLFEHTLADHPAFTMERLAKLLEMTIPHPELLYWDAGQKQINQRWNDQPGRDFPVEEAFRRIRDNGAWIILFGAERDPEISVLLRRSMDQIESLCGYHVFDDVKVRDAYIFITAPRRVTTYHIDFQCGFLLQLHGDKTIHAFDRYDREVTTEEELERFWAKDTNAATYKPEFQSRAHTWVLKPGLGVHLPVTSPHWLRNGDEISVSLSLNFQFKNSRLADIYRANYYLRKLGIQPTAPGISVWRDRAKAHSMATPVAIAKLLKNLNGKKGKSRI